MTITLPDLLDATRDVASPDDTTREASRARVLHAIAVKADAEPSERRVNRQRLPRRRVLAVAASVAALITVPVIAWNRSPAADANAATVLNHAATSAGAQPGGWPNAKYWYVESAYTRDDHQYRRKIWFANNGESVLSDTGLPGLGDGILSLDRGEFTGGGALPPQLSWKQLYALPTDPTVLRKLLSPNDSKGGFDAASDLLRETPAPPAVREALYKVLAAIPGIHTSRNAKDLLGRTGTAVTYGPETLVIDTATGQLLSDTTTGASYTYVRQGPANSAPAATRH